MPKRGNDKIKWIGVTDSIGQVTNVVWSFHLTVVINVLVADKLKFYILFYKTCRLPEWHLCSFLFQIVRRGRFNFIFHLSIVLSSLTSMWPTN